jgi:hypothetical protein
MSIWPFECQREAVEAIKKRLDVLEAAAKPGVERKQFYGPMEPVPSDAPVERSELAGRHRIVPDGLYRFLCYESGIHFKTGEKLAEPQEQEPESDTAELRRKAAAHDGLVHRLNDQGRVVDELTQRAEAAERELAELRQEIIRKQQTIETQADNCQKALQRAEAAERDALAAKVANLRGADEAARINYSLWQECAREKADLEKRLKELKEENERRKGECGGFECVDSEELAELRRNAELGILARQRIPNWVANIDAPAKTMAPSEPPKCPLCASRPMDSGVQWHCTHCDTYFAKETKVEPEPPKCSWCNRPAVEASETEWKCPTSGHRWPKEAAP